MKASPRRAHPSPAAWQVDQYNDGVDIRITVPSARRRKSRIPGRERSALAHQKDEVCTASFVLRPGAYGTREEFVEMLQKVLNKALAALEKPPPGTFTVSLDGHRRDIMIRSSRCPFEILFKVRLLVGEVLLEICFAGDVQEYIYYRQRTS
jgi:hypothetical protein